jgi:hypothetical protein
VTALTGTYARLGQRGIPTSRHLGGAQTQEFPDPLAMSPDGRYLAIGDVNNTSPTLTPASENARLCIFCNGPAITAAEKEHLHGTAVWYGDHLLQAGTSQAGTRIEASSANDVVLGSWPMPARIAIVAGGASSLATAFSSCSTAARNKRGTLRVIICCSPSPDQEPHPQSVPASDRFARTQQPFPRGRRLSLKPSGRALRQSHLADTRVGKSCVRLKVSGNLHALALTIVHLSRRGPTGRE